MHVIVYDGQLVYDELADRTLAGGVLNPRQGTVVCIALDRIRVAHGKRYCSFHALHPGFSLPVVGWFLMPRFSGPFLGPHLYDMSLSIDHLVEHCPPACITAVCFQMQW